MELRDLVRLKFCLELFLYGNYPYTVPTDIVKAILFDLFNYLFIYLFIYLLIYLFIYLFIYWESVASPTLGCSIEILHDICNSYAMGSRGISE